MRPYWTLVPLLGALVSSAEASHRGLDKRQDETTTSSANEDTTTAETSTTSEETTEVTSTTSTNNDDTTVTVTTTVEGDGETVSSRTTRTITSTTTIVNVSTVRETTTVTSRDQETATETVYTTTTVFENRKRDLWLLAPPVPADVTEALPVITAAPASGSYEAEMMRREAQPRANVFKRDTVTETETVTEGGGSTTVVQTVTATVVTATTSRRTTTQTITETDQADASTTVTTTVTFTETSNTASTGVFTETGSTSAPTETNSNNDSGGGGGGLSTGAKAGIGAGAGVAGLVLVAGLAWFCFKKRRGGPSHDGHDDMFGASEVPVGAAGATGGAARPMSHQPSTSASYGPHRSPVLPNVAPEGYRGTAMGDGRAGYAKPEPYGAAYTRPSAQHPPPPSVSPVSPPATGYSHPTTLVGSGGGGDQLPEHHTPADMYGAPAPSTSPGPYGAAELGHEGHNARWQNPGAAEADTTPAGYHQSQQPPSNVFEMPGQDHR